MRRIRSFSAFLFKTKNNSILPSVLRDMRVAAKCTSQAVSFVFFILKGRGGENKKFLLIFI